MKKVLDPIYSKKPMLIPDDADLAKLSMNISNLQSDINELDEKISTLKASPVYLKVVLKSRQKMVDIAFAAMMLPADDVKAISRAQAQFLERKLVTEELSNLETDKKDKESFIERLKGSLNRLSDKINKFKEGRK